MIKPRARTSRGGEGFVSFRLVSHHLIGAPHLSSQSKRKIIYSYYYYCWWIPSQEWGGCEDAKLYDYSRN